MKRHGFHLDWIVASGVISFFLFIFSVEVGSSQPAQVKIKFEHLGVNDGLSNNHVTSITQDSKGYLWVGTNDGLNKYDGYKFTSYRTIPGDSNSLFNNTIKCVFEDSQGKLWVSTDSRGLYYYNRQTDQLISISEFSKKSLIESIKETENKDLWITGKHDGYATTAQLDRNTGKWNFHHVLSSTEPVADLIQLSENTYWISIRNLGLFVWDKLTNKIGENISVREKISTRIEKIKRDSFGNTWFISRDGLFKLAPNSTKFISYKAHAKVMGNSLPVDAVLDVTQEGKYLWIATENGGLCRLEIGANKITIFAHDKNDSKSITDNSVWIVYKDHENRIWAGTYSSGLWVYDKLKYKFQELSIPFENDIVNAICKDNLGRMWIGTEGGLLMKQGSKVFTYKHDARDNGSIDRDPVLSIIQDSRNTIWVGTWDGGLNRYNQKTNDFKHYKSLADNKFTFYDPNVFSIIEDPKMKEILVGGFQGLNILKDEKRDQFIRYIDERSLENNYVRVVFKDHKGYIWLGSQSQLNRFDPRTGERLVFYYDRVSGSGIFVNCILEDLKQRLWVGTNKGLKLLVNGVAQAAYTKEDGLPSDVVRSIVEDSHGNLWLSTTNGISRFNPQLKKFDNYDVSDGLLNNEFKPNSSFKDNDGYIYFGGKGVNVFHPDSILINTHIPSVFITDLKLFNQSIKIGGDDKILAKHISETKEIFLDYEKSVFTLDFVALNFTSSNKNQFIYKLDGFDKDWVKVGAQRSATYTNLDPGRYTFHVNASNNDGIWNNEGAVLVIHILPPWWELWWVRASMVVIVFGALLFVYRTRIRDRYVSQLKDLNKKLESEMHMVDFLMQNLPALIYIKDLNSRFIRISTYMANYFKRDKEEILGKTDFDIHEPKRAQEAFNDEQEIIRTGKVKDHYYEREVYQDGTEKWVSSVKMPLLNADGIIVGTFGISTDVTDVKQQNDELLLREEEITAQNEELHVHREKLALQNEKLTQSQYELAAQNQKLQTSEEELTQKVDQLNSTQAILEDKNKEIDAKEKQLRQIFDGVPGMIFQLRMTPAGELSLPVISKGSKAIYDVEPDAMMSDGLSVLTKLHPSDVIVFQEALKKSFTDLDKEHNLELRVQVEGKIKWIQSSSVPEKLEDGSILWSGIILDISKRKEAEAELNRTREMLEQTNHMARVGGWELDRINKVVTWSQVTKEIHEVPTDFMPDATMSIDFYKEGVNRDRFIKVTNLAIKEGIPFDERLQIVTASGNELWVRVMGNSEFRSGECKRLYGTFQDIDQQVRASIVLALQREEMAALNEEMVQNAEEISTQRDLLTDQNSKLLKAQLIIEKQNHEILSRNENLEDEVTKRTKEIIEYNHQLEQFAFISAHNLRAPVARILGLGHILKLPNQLESEKEEIVHKLIDTTFELDTVVKDLNQILEVKKESNQPLVELNIFQELVRTETFLQNEIAASHAIISKDFSRVEIIKTVKPYLDSILSNLMSNAIKYRHPRRNPRIDIQSDIVGEYVCLRISDNGLGIDLESYKDKIFNLYKRFHYHVEGKGLGLYLVKTQIDSLGGKIEVESKVNEGTTFRVYFKLA